MLLFIILALLVILAKSLSSPAAAEVDFDTAVAIAGLFRVPFWGSVNPSPLGDGMRSIQCDANG